MNVTINATTTILVPKPIVPNYSVSVYYIFMFILLLISITAFSMLHFSKTAIKSRRIDSTESKKNKILPEDMIASKHIYETKNETANDKNSLKEQIILNVMLFFVSFVCYGILPGLQSYSTLPYGNYVFTLSVNLSYICITLVILLSMSSFNVSVTRISIEFAVSIILAAYIIVIAATSPCPILLQSWIGPTLIITSWIIAQCLFMRIRCLIATRLERFGQRSLLILGMVTIVGHVIGGIIIYICVDTYRLFKDKPTCVDDFSYCQI
jgi:riboflavin transporter 2